MHELDIILTLSVALAAALLLGFIAHRVGLSPILGYLLAGVALGPHTPGFVADAQTASQLAEIGVVLLMFGVGLHFHFRDLLAVKSVAIPGALCQTIVATALGLGVARLAGWNFSAGLVLGLAVSVASTVVLMRVLTEFNQLETVHGHIAVGWLVVEDIFTILVVVVLPALVSSPSADGESTRSVPAAIGSAVLRVGFLGLLMFGVGGRAIPWMLNQVARTRSRELFTLTVLVIALCIATGSTLIFGVSMALGAFLAGMVVGQSELSHQAAADALPLRDAFAVLFFVSVGMLFDGTMLLTQPVFILALLAIVLLGKPLAALLIVLLLGHPVRTALTIAIALAQIGEFSFILADLGRRLNVLPSDGHGALIAVAMISIALNPILFRTIGPLERWLQRRERFAALAGRRARALEAAVNRQTKERLETQEASQAVVVGYGPVGQTVFRVLTEFELQPVVVDLNVDAVKRLTSRGKLAIYGDAASSEVLRAAGIETARYLVVTLPDLPNRIAAMNAARRLNPGLKIYARAHYLAERAALTDAGATRVCYEEAETAVALAEELLLEIGADKARLDEEVAKIRRELAARES